MMMDLEKYFHSLRHDKRFHLGLGDVRLTMGMQAEIIDGTINKSSWVSVEKHLPDEQGYYLVWIEHPVNNFKRVDRVFFRGKTRWAHSEDYITHWMYLPDKPE